MHPPRFGVKKGVGLHIFLLVDLSKNVVKIAESRLFMVRKGVDISRKSGDRLNSRKVFLSAPPPGSSGFVGVSSHLPFPTDMESR